MYDASPTDGPLRQSEILSDIVRHVLTDDSVGTGKPAAYPITHQYVILASQDCDLEQDFFARSSGKTGALLPSILFYETTPALQLVKNLATDLRKLILQNKNERYQVLQRVPSESDAAGKGIGDLGIDFKRYFSMPTQEVYRLLALGAQRRCYMLSPYLEHFAIRAARFQCRVALPKDHEIVIPTN